MSRNLEVEKIMKNVAESKLVNLDLPMREIINSGVTGVMSASDEPWDLICYTWVTLIHRGPISSIDEILALSRVIEASLAVKEVAAGRAVQRGG